MGVSYINFGTFHNIKKYQVLDQTNYSNYESALLCSPINLR